MGLTPTYAWPTPELTDPANVPVDMKELADAIDATVKSTDAATVPVGAVMMWPSAAPPGAQWKLCDGSTLDAVTYDKLATVLGQAGGLVTLPDLRGRVVLGVSGTHALKSTGGADSVALTTAEVPAHTHGVGTLSTAAGGWHNHGGVTGNNGPWTHTARLPIGIAGNGGVFGGLQILYADNRFLVVDDTPAHGHSITADPGHTHAMAGATAAIGGGATHENLPPYLAINYIIRVV